MHAPAAPVSAAPQPTFNGSAQRHSAPRAAVETTGPAETTYRHSKPLVGPATLLRWRQQARRGTPATRWARAHAQKHGNNPRPTRPAGVFNYFRLHGKITPKIRAIVMLHILLLLPFLFDGLLTDPVLEHNRLHPLNPALDTVIQSWPLERTTVFDIPLECCTILWCHQCKLWCPWGGTQALGQRTRCLHQSRATSTVEHDVALLAQGS